MLSQNTKQVSPYSFKWWSQQKFLKKYFYTKIKKSNTLCLFCHHQKLVHQQQTHNKQWAASRKLIEDSFFRWAKDKSNKGTNITKNGKQQKCFNCFLHGCLHILAFDLSLNAILKTYKTGVLWYALYCMFELNHGHYINCQRNSILYDSCSIR